MSNNYMLHSPLKIIAISGYRVGPLIRSVNGLSLVLLQCYLFTWFEIGAALSTKKEIDITSDTEKKRIRIVFCV